MFRINFLVACLVVALAACSGNDYPKQDSKNELEKEIHYINELEKETYYRITVNDNVGFIDANGKIKIEPQFDEAYNIFTEGVCYAEIGNRKGLIDVEGNFIVEFADTVINVNNFINGWVSSNCQLVYLLSLPLNANEFQGPS